MDDGRQNSIGNGDEPGLRELAARLLAPPYPSDAPGAESEEPELFVGRLPDGMPVKVPFPEGAIVVGCAAYKPPRGGQYFDILLDAAPSAEQFRGAYRRQLLAAGWSEEDDLPPRRGFVPRNMPLFFRLARRFPHLRRRFRLDRQEIPPFFRLGARAPKLWFVAFDRPGAPTDVRLKLSVKQRDPWLHHDIAWTVIPRLSSPPDTRRSPEPYETNVLHPPFDTVGKPFGGGGPYEPDGAYSYATLETGLDLAELAAHYAAQLEDAGWTRADRGQSGRKHGARGPYATRKTAPGPAPSPPCAFRKDPKEPPAATSCRYTLTSRRTAHNAVQRKAAGRG